MIRVLIVILLFSTANVYSQTLNSNWKEELNTELSLFNNCDDTPTAGVNPCNKFIGSAFKTVYNINDFYAKKEGRYMLVNEIAYFLKNTNKWRLIGHGYEQKALTEAQSLANAKKAVVAVYVNEEGLGRVAIIVPGELRMSGIWGLQVPNSASFFPSEKEKSYINKSLSYSFERTQVKSVLLYARNY